MSQFYELYRSSSLGVGLTESLDELIMAGKITPQLAMKVLNQFDKSMTEALANKVKSRASFKGHLQTYRFCDDVWTFVIENPSFRFENDVFLTEKIKIVACNAKKPGET